MLKPISPGSPSGPLELWGGLECTVNRVGDAYFDQLGCGRYETTVEDFDRFADLGLRGFRMPVLWERVAPRGPDGADWSWTDPRLGRLRERGVNPIVGLVHHGSGPRGTSLVHPSFAEGLARFARTVAERYPWVRDYTPVNEPLTTARFSGLYGHWYPHGRDDRTFVRALFNQCRAVAMAMRAIREVRPDARLVQTEDLGKSHSTPTLAYQAEMENERRWLTFDLLSGKVRRGHPLRPYLLRSGLREADLGWFVENPCPPDVLGINHYVTSERFLDHRLERYPAAQHGGNGRHRYADVEAVRVMPEGACGPRALLGEAWDRYRSTIAVTEAHLGCTREEQMRWFVEVWDAARGLRREGADILAVTAWSLLGSFDWASLVTRDEGYYEPGVFDLRAPEPRPTAMAGLLSTLARDDEPDHPVLASAGWWRRPDRLLPWARPGADEPRAGSTHRPARPLLILGDAGPLAHAFKRLCDRRALPSLILSKEELDPASDGRIASVLDARHPWAVVVAGDLLDPADNSPSLAGACANRGISLLAVSSGNVLPKNRDGSSLEAALVVRTGALFGPWDEDNFVLQILRRLVSGLPIVAAEDAIVAPTYLPDLVDVSLNLLIDGERGVWHLAHPGAIPWAAFARKVALLAGFDPAPVSIGLASATNPAKSLVPTSGRGQLMPSLDDALARFFAESEAPWTAEAPAALAPIGTPSLAEELFPSLNYQHG